MSSNEEVIENKDAEVINVTTSDFLTNLQSRVSIHDAKLILDSAMAGTGLNVESESRLTRDDAKSLCLELIKRGGPAFQVGTQVYKQNQLS